ncbi:dienelactone hydrolase family protein [uncultured Rhodoblastus sp.]|uniref:dienelactone hydrolase family protein n=1 Tax=uncultured Rhodoblastus sp. TaxID=543037 RepID=UPI0025DDECFE|nr:dienelactone hydrolase family protein [uncultured Rhodoblastus sp.]
MSDDKTLTVKALSKASDFHPEVLRLFDRYVHGLTSRRGFLTSASTYAAVSGATAVELLDALNPRFAAAQKIPPADPRIKIEFVEIDSPQGYGKVRGLLARPAHAQGKLPVVLVIHENRGLNPHIEDIARRLAVDNFIAFAPDALFPLGGYPGDEDKARELFPKLEQPKTREDFVAAALYAQNLPDGNGKVGVVGFCYGGGIVNFLATRVPSIVAGAPFYGAPPPLDQVGAIKAELVLQFAGKDERINGGWPAYEAALQKAGVKYQAYVYPGVEHGFNNDTTPRFDQAAADLAWARTLELFNRTLRG